MFLSVLNEISEMLEKLLIRKTLLVTVNVNCSFFNIFAALLQLKELRIEIFFLFSFSNFVIVFGQYRIIGNIYRVPSTIYDDLL